MSRSFDYLVFIGRFQPFHDGHLAIIRAALEQADRVIVLLGSAARHRSGRNPWSAEERESMLRGALGAEERARLLSAPLRDHLYNEQAWLAEVQAVVAGLVRDHPPAEEAAPRIGLIGQHGGGEGYYPRRFPQWPAVPGPTVVGVSGSGIRERFFAGAGNAFDGLSGPVRHWLQAFRATHAHSELQRELGFVRDYRAAWAAAPYEPIFATVDALVVQSGHLLMVTRDRAPGAGLLAMPGGFVDPREALEEACLRELLEETQLEVAEEQLRCAIRGQRVFDDPYRSERGRTITHVFLIELPPAVGLPKVRGADDARHAHWLPLAAIDPARCFEDHWFIIQEMLCTG